MRHLVLLLAICSVVASAADKNQLPTLETKVEPDWGTLTSGYVLDTASVELVMLPSGEPFSIKSSSSLPDAVVRALAQWRFTKYRKDGRDIAFNMTVKLPIRRLINDYYEVLQQPDFRPSDDLDYAIQQASGLDDKKAARLLSKLPESESANHPRTTLLTYYSSKGASDVETARKVRRDLISWLIQNDPQDTTLRSSSAIVNASGEPLADPETTKLLMQKWLDVVKQHPTDVDVVTGATNFLRAADPAATLQIISGLPDSSRKNNLLGTVYALAGLGVSAISPDKGRAIAVSSPSLVESGPAASARHALLGSSNLNVVLSGMWATTNVAQTLADRKVLPAGYAEFCQALLQHTRKLYPTTSANCDLAAVDDEVAEANLRKKVQPVYPDRAKQQGIQGRVEFTAVIGTDGHPHSVELLHGPFALYEESYKAVSQWEWKPTLIHGVPKAVVTEIRVNYEMQRH